MLISIRQVSFARKFDKYRSDDLEVYVRSSDLVIGDLASLAELDS